MPQVSLSGKSMDQVPRDAPMSVVEQVLQLFAHSCRQRTGRQREREDYVDAPTNMERARWCAARVVRGTSETT